MKSILSGFLALKQKQFLIHKVLKSSMSQYNFDSNEEILENFLLDHIMLIGINLPDSKNKLTETAAEKLCDSLKKFCSNDEVSVAVLHGTGGNFCSGVIQTEKALNHCKEIINVLHEAKKPIVGALNGRIINFGFHIAIMCDLKVLEETSFVGFGSKTERLDVSPVVFRKLVHTVGLSGASHFLLTSLNMMWKQANNIGFASKVSPYGATLGESIHLAHSIAMTPLDKIKEEKAMINHYLES